MRPLHLSLVIGLTVLADQATKAVAHASLAIGQPQAVIPGFNFALGFNEGASFGMMGNVMTGRPLLMAALTGLLTLVFAITAVRARGRLEQVGLALIVGGAVGNIVDRLRQGAVTDFLDLYWRTWHWPTFNGAGIAITLGALCILAASLPLRRRKELSLDQP
jgi:signal peptidase II